MLRFTPTGAVAAPTTLQIRVTREYPGRVAAGAPEATGELSAAEVLANVEHFTVGAGPRGRPVDRLVLAGVGLGARPGLAEAVDAARSLGIAGLTVHLGRGERAGFAGSALADRADAVAVAVRDAVDVADVAALVGSGPHVVAVALLDAPGLASLPDTARALSRTGVDRVVLTWPLTGAPPPSAAAAAAAALAALEILDTAGVAAGVKGLPACRLGGAERLWRSANRWYVDAAHQRGAALLFFPDVVRFGKGESCRFCAADARCDGAPRAWLDAGLVGALTPL